MKLEQHKANMKPIKGLKLADSFINGYKQLPPSRIYLTCYLFGSLGSFYKQQKERKRNFFRGQKCNLHAQK